MNETKNDFEKDMRRLENSRPAKRRRIKIPRDHVKAQAFHVLALIAQYDLLVRERILKVAMRLNRA